MDRQSLLEKKRQRLQELKQRRLGESGTTLENTSFEDIADTLKQQPSEARQVSVAIQTDQFPKPNHPDPGSYVPGQFTRSEGVVTFDKGIQVEPLILDDENLEETLLEPQAKELPLVTEDEKLGNGEHEAAEVEVEVNQELLQSLKRLNKVIAKDPGYPSLFADFAKTVPIAEGVDDAETEKLKTPFHIEQSLPPIEGRSISSIDISNYLSGLLVVSYSGTSKAKKSVSSETCSSRIRHSPGLAVIYSIKEDKPFPEMFLECTSPISRVRFDRSTPSKIIGGLITGKIVIWDLADIKEDKIGILPTLKSSVISSIGSTLANRKDESSVRLIHHTSPIIYIDQLFSDHSSSILTISNDGVINVWSSNLLETPKLNSIKLYATTEAKYLNSSFIEPVTVETALTIGGNSNDLMKHSKSSASHDPEYRFMDKLLVGSNSGVIYALENNKESGFIKSVHENELEDETSHANKIVTMIELSHRNQSYLLTSHLNWTLQLWDLTEKEPVLTIPTSSIITAACVRPGFPLQFVTVGTFDESEVKPTIQFWDLNCRLMNPITELPLVTDEEVLTATSILFNDLGNKLIIGFSDGSATVWSIDDEAINETIENNRNLDVDEGFISLMAQS